MANGGAPTGFSPGGGTPLGEKAEILFVFRPGSA